MQFLKSVILLGMTALFVACGSDPADLSFTNGNNLSFGEVTVSTESVQELTVKNFGEMPGKVDKIVFSDDQFSLDEDSSTCGVGTSLNENSVCRVGVRFVPRFTGLQESKVTVRYVTDEMVFSLTGNLSGVGVSPLKISTNVISFGLVDVTLFESKRVTLQNTGKTAVGLEMLDSTLMSANSSFQLDASLSTCSIGMQLASFESCDLFIAYAPQNEGVHSKEVRIGFSLNEQDLMLSLNLVGRGMLNCSINTALSSSYDEGQTAASAQNQQNAARGRADGEALTFVDGYDENYTSAYNLYFNAAYDESYKQGYYNGERDGYSRGYFSTDACLDGQYDGSYDGSIAGQTNGALDGYDDGYLQGEAFGSDDGYYDGYTASCGYSTYSRIMTPEASKFASQCESKGYENVIDTSAYSDARAQAIAQNTQYQNGLRAGSSAGAFDGGTDGSEQGYEVGYTDGLEVGIPLGLDAAYDECYVSSYDSAYDQEYAIAYGVEFDYGYDDGYVDGYDLGYIDGEQACSDENFSTGLVIASNDKASRKSYGLSTKLIDAQTLKSLKARAGIRGKLNNLSSELKKKLEKTFDKSELRTKLRQKKAAERRLGMPLRGTPVIR